MSSPVTIWVAPAMMLWCWWIYRRQTADVASQPNPASQALAAS